MKSTTLSSEATQVERIIGRLTLILESFLLKIARGPLNFYKQYTITKNLLMLQPWNRKRSHLNSISMKSNGCQNVRLSHIGYSILGEQDINRAILLFISL